MSRIELMPSFGIMSMVVDKKKLRENEGTRCGVHLHHGGFLSDECLMASAVSLETGLLFVKCSLVPLADVVRRAHWKPRIQPL